MTLYRTSGDSSIIRSLIRAAESGKQVAVLVELKARFDEAANIEWAKALEEVGVHVVYGLVGLKTHTKTAAGRARGARRAAALLPHRHRQLQPQDGHDLRGPRAVHRRPGDRHRPDPAVQLPHRFRPRPSSTSKLIVAPDQLRHRFERARSPTRRRTAPSGRIIAKMNSLSDPEMIDALYDASRGRRADRPRSSAASAACARGCPGCPRTSGSARSWAATSSTRRIYHFANGGGPGGPCYLIGSADLMTRNINRRVEALVPVDEPAAPGPARRRSSTSPWPTTGWRGSSAPTDRWQPGRGRRRASTPTCALAGRRRSVGPAAASSTD